MSITKANTTTQIGTKFKNLTFDEWQAYGSSFGESLQTTAWSVGDWLIYGEDKFGGGRVASESYDEALKSTKLDRATLKVYASVSKSIPYDERSEAISFGHHRVLAPLDKTRREAWIKKLNGEDTIPTVKRLALSIRSQEKDAEPHILADSEILKNQQSQGKDNYVIHLTRLITNLRAIIPSMDDYERKSLKADFRDLLTLLKSL